MSLLLPEDLETMIQEFAREDYKYVVGTALESIRYAIDYIYEPVFPVPLDLVSRTRIYRCSIKGECARIKRIIRYCGTQVKNTKLMKRLLVVNTEICGLMN